jgi:hypothetical protein
MPRALILALLCTLVVACGGSPEDQLEKARGHLAGGDYAQALAAADQGLAAGAKGSTAWRLELLALEGEARSGKAADAQTRLERLAEGWSEQVSGGLYVQTAGQVKEAGDASEAISLLDAGARRFPEDEDIARAITQLQATGSDDEIERLRSLGYVE